MVLTGSDDDESGAEHDDDEELNLDADWVDLSGTLKTYILAFTISSVLMIVSQVDLQRIRVFFPNHAQCKPFWNRHRSARIVDLTIGEPNKSAPVKNVLMT